MWDVKSEWAPPTTPTTPAIEISPPCDVSYQPSERIRMLGFFLIMASSKGFLKTSVFYFLIFGVLFI